MKVIRVLIICLVLVNIGCEQEKDTFSVIETNWLIQCKGQGQIEAKSDHPIIYTSENEFIATVTNYGIINANHIGETRIKVESNGIEKFVGVEVFSRFNFFYRIPLTDWSLKKEDLISFYGEPDASQSDAIGYEDSHTKSNRFAFFFDIYGNYDYSATYLEKSGDINEYVDFLEEQYLFVEKQNNIMVYINDLSVLNATVFAAIDESSPDYYITLFTNSESFKSVKNRIDEVMKFIKK